MTASFKNTKSAVLRHKEHIVMVKGSIQQEYVTTINIHAPNNRAPKFMKKKPTELKEKQAIQQ